MFCSVQIYIVRGFLDESITSETSVNILFGQDCAKSKNALISNTKVVLQVAMKLMKELPQEQESKQNAQFRRLCRLFIVSTIDRIDY